MSIITVMIPLEQRFNEIICPLSFCPVPSFFVKYRTAYSDHNITVLNPNMIAVRLRGMGLGNDSDYAKMM